MSDTITDFLKNASLFELYQLHLLIGSQLDDPVKIERIKRRLKPGMVISYFEPSENRLIDAEILKIKRTRLDVRNLHDNRRWNIPFYYVNINDLDETEIVKPAKGLNKTDLRVGDQVSFCDKQNNLRCGEIIRLNKKTATILTDEFTKWRVAYQLLELVIDAEISRPQIDQGELF